MIDEEIVTTPEPATSEKSESGKKSTVRKAKAKKKVAQQVALGRAYIQATYNNTIVTVTDMQGNTLAWCSSGHMGFKGPKKATPYAASVIMKNIADKVRPIGVQELHVFVQGVGSGREAAVRGLNAQGFSVLSIKDTTPLPHNGCRAPRPRRV